MTPTRPGPLVGMAVIAAAVGFGLLRIVGAANDSVPKVSWLMVATLGLLALALTVATVVARPRLSRKEGTTPIPALVAGRLVAVAFAASRAGALLAGFYVGWALVGLIDSGGISTSYARGRLLTSGLAALFSLAVCLVGLWLERLCRVRRGPDDEMGLGSRT